MALPLVIFAIAGIAFRPSPSADGVVGGAVTPSWAFLGKAMARADERVGARRPGVQGDFVVSLERSRVDLADPRLLGIHSAVSLCGVDDALPAYVEREFDFQLRTALAA